MKRALVTGGSGVLGLLLVRRLAEQGIVVRSLVRRASGGAQAGVEIVRADVRDAESVRKAAAGVDAVFHLAALLHQDIEAPAEEYRDVNVGGTANVAAAAAENGCRLIYFSTISVYGPTPGFVADEDSACAPETPYAKTKLEAEDVVRERAARHVILRMAAVYGREMKGNYARLAAAMKRGLFVPVGRGENRRTLVHEDDAIDAAILAATATAAEGQTFNATDGEVHTVAEIIGAIAEAAGRRPLPVRVPRGAATIAARILDAGRREGRWSRAIDKYFEDVAVRGTKIQTVLGFRPRFDLRSGWRDALARTRG